MKKDYIKPEVEVVSFQGEELMTATGDPFSPSIVVVPRGMLETP